MTMLVSQILNLRIRLERRNIQSARDRVLHYLTANADERERTVVLPSTVKDLAAELGLNAPGASEMRACGEIARFNGTIRLVVPL